MFSQDSRLLTLLTGALLLRPTLGALEFEIGDGLKQISDKAWASASSSPNATGSVALSGYNVSQEWPGESISGWSLDLKVMADVPSKNVDDKFYTGLTFSLSAPDELQTKQDNGSTILQLDNSTNSTWAVCMTIISHLPEETIKDGYDDDGSCYAMLGEKCVDALKAQAVSESACGLKALLPDGCDQRWFGANSFYVPLDSPDLLSDALVSVAADKPHDKGNTTEYESAVKHTYPVIVGWNGHRVDGAAGVQSGDMTEMMCLRANKITKGSQEVDMDDDSAASRGPLAATWAVIAGMVFTALL